MTDTTFQIETLSGLVEATVHAQDGHVQLVTVDMGKPRFEKKRFQCLVNRPAQRLMSHLILALRI